MSGTSSPSNTSGAVGQPKTDQTQSSTDQSQTSTDQIQTSNDQSQTSTNQAQTPLVPPISFNDCYDITVKPVGTTHPVVSRRLCVPAFLTFDQLATSIKIAFDLRGRRNWQFNISNPGYWSAEEARTNAIETNEHYRDIRERDIRYFANFVPRAEWKRERTHDSLGAYIHDHGFWGLGRDENNRPIDYWFVYGVDRKKAGGGWLYQITVNRRANLHTIRVGVDGLQDGQRTFCIEGNGHTIAENCKGPRHWQAMKVACRAPARNVGTYRSSENRRVVWRNEEDRLRRFFTKKCINGHGLSVHYGLNADEFDRNEVNERLYRTLILPEHGRDRLARLGSKIVEGVTGEVRYGLTWREAWHGVEQAEPVDNTEA